MSKKLRLDIWNKSFWKERHFLTGFKDGLLDSIFPPFVSKIVKVGADLIDDNELNNSAKEGDEAYKKAHVYAGMIYFAGLILLLLFKVIGFEEFVELFKLVLEFTLSFNAASFGGMLLLGAVLHGQQFRVKQPEINPETKIFGQGEPLNYYQTTIKDAAGNVKVCKDFFNEIVTASSHVDYPFGIDKTKRATKYIEQNLSRFELIEVDEEEL